MEENMYENKILDAIQMLVDNAIDKATFDKTIRGVISKCVDEKNGKYIVIYQDSSFYAYSTDTNQTYSAGTPVYVLVPRNDMTQTKTIIGSVNKLGSDYINTIENSDRYEVIGNSVATLNSEQGICSYKNNGDVLVLYDKNAVSSIVDIDTIAATTYIKQAKYLTLGGEFRTALAKEQRYKGNYGLGFDINFTDNMTNETVKRTYLVDVNNMLGNPYEYTKASNQKVVFDIDGANFVDIDKIYLFCYDFPVTTVETKPDDIFVINLTLEAAATLTDDELAGNKLTLITPQGIYFSNNDSITSSRKIDTEVKIDNKVVNKDSSLLKYFWFKENYSINTSSLLYNRYGGNGWECLNEYNIVETDGNNNPTIIDWITNQSSYLIRKNNTIARETDYKCVVSYNNEIVLTKKFTVYNYSSNYVITIDSDSGTYFSYDNGRPTLTCSVNQTGNYEYIWGMMNGNGAFTPIQETTTTNAAYHTAADRYAELETGLRNGTIVLTAAIQQEFSNLKYTLEQYNNDIMRVEDNVIYNLKLNMITNFATFVCSVYNNGAYIGKGSIKIENDLNTSDNSYTLIINNGDQVFKYNGDGISPTSRSLDKPQELYPLSFTLYDEKGNEISNDVINADKVYWTVPTSDTMIKVSAVHGNPSEIDEYAETATYTGYKSFNFEIPVLYTTNKTRNTIQLKVKYKNKIIVANTELMFLKEGESGSNGTDFICRIVPNTIDGAIPPLYPIVTWNNNAEVGTTNPTINFTPRSTNVWFKAQLYHNGSEIFDGVSSGVTTENKNVVIKWEILKNKYYTDGNNNIYEDVSNFNVNSSTGVFSYDNLDNISNVTLKENPANIVKCTLTYDGIDYVATMPIILVKVNNSAAASYSVTLNENTGFRYAMYTTDGRTPIYDNSNPFSLKVIQTVENVDQDISTNTLTNYAVDYNWSVKGLIYTNEWETQSNLILDTLRSRNLQRNEKYYKPIDNFNGLCLSNALFCDIKRNNQTLATIHLPIDMYLNRYGQAAMNSWDGNHIAIDEDGGFILAPQVGAGRKEQDNSFTGVFMGTVQEGGASEEEVGLFGYNNGARTLELNAKDGSAKFGTVGSGQIIIQPGEDKATIQSRGYEIIKTQASGKYLAGRVYFSKSGNTYTELVPGTDYTIGDNIVGSNIYVWSSGSGMEIDLKDPHIRFGSGNFRIDPDGNVYAKGYATIAELEAGDVNIPGIENWKAEYTTDRVQFETDSTLTPVDTNLTKTITGKCLYKDSYVSGYTVQLVDASGNPITHDQTTDGIGISTDVTGQVFTISFNAQSQYTWTNAVNNYNFKFSYTPIGSATQTIIKQFSANAVIMAEDGRSITSVEVRYQSGTSGTTPPSDESGWIVNPPSVAQGNYLWTRTKINYSTGNPDISYSVAYMGTDGQQGQAGASSYTYVRYSINSTGNPMVDTPTSETKYVGIYSGNSSTVPAYTAFTWSKYVGENGAPGVGVSNTEIKYQGSSSGTTPPSSEAGWVDSPPTVTQGNYLWTRVKITYTNNTTSTSYSVSYIAEDGATGTSYYTYIRYSENSDGSNMVTNPTSSTKYIGVYSGSSSTVPAYTAFTWSKYMGDNGDNGRGITSVVIAYQEGTSGTTPPSNVSGWVNNPPSVTPGNYLWTRAITNYTDSSSPSISYSVARMGLDGQTGAQGPAGPAGKDGTSVTVKGSYNTLSDLITAHPSGNTLGDGYVVGNNLYVYTNAAGGGGSQTGDWNDVGQFKGLDAKRCFIVASTEVFKSTNGGNTFTPTSTTITPYFQAVSYTSWAYSTNGGSSFTTITGTVSGISIDNTSKALTLQNSSTLFNTNSTLVFKCSTDDADVFDTITITKIQDGVNGRGVTSTSVTYQAGTSGTVEPSGTWSSSVPSVSAGQFLWTKTVLTYTDNTSTTSYAVAYRGTNGTSITISSQSIQYAQGDSGTTAPSSGWQSAIPSVADGKYLWTKTTVNYSDNTTTTSYSVSYQSADGVNGISATNIVCGNEAQAIVCNASGNVSAATTITIPFAGYIGSSRAACSVTYSTLPSGITLTSNTAATTSTDGSLVLAVAANSNLGGTTNGVITLTFSCNSQTFVKKFNWAKSLQGNAGADGKNTYVKYSDNNYQFTSNNGDDQGGFIGLCSITSATAPTTFNSYTWSRLHPSVGVNKWRVDIYTKTNITGNGPIVIGDLDNETYVKTILVPDNMTTTWGYGDNFLAKVETFVYCTEAFSVTSTAKSDDGSTLYLNGTAVKTLTSCQATSITLDFVKGWNDIYFAFNEATGSEYAYLGFDLANHAKVKYMTAYEDDKSSMGIDGEDGAAGANAKVVNIRTSSQMFKSTTGANGTFTPQYIYLYPEFQGCSYSKWQYWNASNSTWTDVTSGSNSLTIGTYDSIANTLRIERNSNLYTSSVTAVSFKCISNTSSVYSIATVVKIYDVTELRTGAKNLFRAVNSNNYSFGNKTAPMVTYDSTNGYFTYTGENAGDQALVGKYTANIEGATELMVNGANVSVSPSGSLRPIIQFRDSEGAIIEDTARTVNGWTYNIYYKAWYTDSALPKVLSVPEGAVGARFSVSSGTTDSVHTSWLCITTGNIPTSWIAASEDLPSNQILQYTTTSTATPPTSSAIWGASIPISTEFYIWQRLQTVYEGNINENSVPVCIYTPPIQISSIEEQYFIHTSSTVAPDQNSTSWLNQKPEWKDEYYQPTTRRYLWVRTKYTYTGNISKIEYSVPYYDPTWETISALNASIIENAQAVDAAINNGYVTIKDGYIEIRDTADSSKGILLSKEGISFKVNGNTYTSVWSLDGTFNAQSILVKNLNASNILSGTLTLQENKDYAANNGVLLLINQSGSEVAKIDVNGLKITAVDGSYIYLRTGEDDNTKKGIYLVDATGNTFVSTNTTNGIFTVTKQVITDYQEYGGGIRVISIGTRGIGFIGVSE